MRNHLFGTLCAAVGCLALAVPPAAAQTQPGSADRAKIPRGADGRPDLAGVWDFRSLMPLERPKELGTKEWFTAEEAAAIEQKAAASAAAADSRTEKNRRTQGDVARAYNSFWMDAVSGNNSRRTSIIVDPPDGRLPPTVPGAIRQQGSYGEHFTAGERPVRYRGGGLYPAGPEDRGLAERCLLGFNAGPPLLPGGYNQNIQIFQTSSHVAILHEMVHDARIVPLDGRPHLPEGIRQWMGDARGRWDGDTLVIESTNFTDKILSFNDSSQSGMGTGRTLHLTERFRRLDANTLEYSFTVNDPATFTRPFTGILPLRKSEEPVFEYACHEANYAMTNMLSGARQEEADGRRAK
jgi:hypothetical protein